MVGLVQLTTLMELRANLAEAQREREARGEACDGVIESHESPCKSRLWRCGLEGAW